MKREPETKMTEVEAAEKQFRFIRRSNFEHGIKRGIGYGKDGSIYSVTEPNGKVFVSKKITLSESIQVFHDLNNLETETGDGSTYEDDALSQWLMQIKKAVSKPGKCNHFLGAN